MRRGHPDLGTHHGAVKSRQYSDIQMNGPVVYRCTKLWQLLAHATTSHTLYAGLSGSATSHPDPAGVNPSWVFISVVDFFGRALGRKCLQISPPQQQTGYDGSGHEDRSGP